MANLDRRQSLYLNLGFFMLYFISAECLDSLKTRPSVHDSSDRWKAIDTSGSSLWTPEYYDGLDKYKKDFITSNNDDKYSPFYASKTHHGYSPFSSGSHYSSLGYDRRPIYSSGRPLDYGLQDYENAYNNGHQTHGFSLNPLYGTNDLTKSVWIPVAGAALLGIAAALAANPVLLHLGVSAGKRKRRSFSANAHHLAYRAQPSTDDRAAHKGQ
ncbi:uncharacterized protein LOC121599298 [Anopheles merus]|uniref:uncharacterized protein LOC121599298 n=1 Tax=Anopheles merus TaxID=30066 RepID=UPI001BE4692F|nr:uncharacterized protein LOC121599298 [Anopheles merus]